MTSPNIQRMSDDEEILKICKRMDPIAWAFDAEPDAYIERRRLTLIGAKKEFVLQKELALQANSTNKNESEADVARSILDALNSPGPDGRNAMMRLGWRQLEEPIYDDEGFEIVIDDRIYRIEISYMGHE